MKEQRDRFLTEAMGACWHVYDPEKPLMTYSLIAYVCEKCHNFILGSNDFSIPEDFTKLWAWAKAEGSLGEFVALYEKGMNDGSLDRDRAAVISI